MNPHETEKRFISMDVGSLGRIAADMKAPNMRKDCYENEAGGAVGYQTTINETLRRSIEAPSLEALIRRAVREELRASPDAA